MQILVMIVTPEQAKAWLANQKTNRVLRWSLVKKYSRLMTLGAWSAYSNESIAINDNGQMIDGQHRCHAVIMCGKPIEMAVVYGANEHIGIGLNRRLSDVARISYGIEMTVNEQSITSSLYLAWRKGGMSMIDLMDLFTRHRQAIAFAANLMPHKRYIAHAVVGAALARAYYHEDNERLREFMKIYSTGLYNVPEDNAAFLLRERLLNNSLYDKAKYTPEERYYLTEAAIRAFCERRRLGLLKSVSKELYPLNESGQTSLQTLTERQAEAVS